MKVQKIVSLDEETMRKARQIPNFSAWVRQNLRLHGSGADLASIERRTQLWVSRANALQDWIYANLSEKMANDAMDYAEVQQIRARQPGQD